MNYKKWQEIKNQGKKNYIFRYIINTAIPIAIIADVLFIVFKNLSFKKFISEFFSLNFLEYVIGSILFFIIFGYFYGLIIWNLNNEKYKE